MRRFLLLFLASGLCAGGASAVPVMWTLQGVTFSDGGTASGSFVYDADTNTYSSINVSTTAGTVVTTPATYQFLDPGFPSASGELAAFVTATGDLTGVRVVALVSTAPMTDAGGTVTLVPVSSGEGVCSNSVCSTAGELRSLSAGSLNGQAVAPVPALSTWAMLGTVLLLGASAFLMLRKSLA